MQLHFRHNYLLLNLLSFVAAVIPNKQRTATNYFHLLTNGQLF